jgi:Ca2+/H+ antiporter, TMEM165/GDT1 family
MKRYWIFRGLTMVALAALVLGLSGYVVMALWNAVLPAVTGLHAISFAQAVALLVLSRILFGGLRGWGRRGGHWRARIRARWQHMTPEERDRFKDALGSRGCRHGDAFTRF